MNTESEPLAESRSSGPVFSRNSSLERWCSTTPGEKWLPGGSCTQKGPSEREAAQSKGWSISGVPAAFSPLFQTFHSTAQPPETKGCFPQG